jgi:hypothetical protein
LLFGGLIDIFCSVFGARDENGNVRQMRLILAVALSTMITGYSGYYITLTFKIMVLDPTLGNFILIVGIISGIVGGYLSLILWKRIFRKDSTGRSQ